MTDPKGMTPVFDIVLKTHPTHIIGTIHLRPHGGHFAVKCYGEWEKNQDGFIRSFKSIESAERAVFLVWARRGLRRKTTPEADRASQAAVDAEEAEREARARMDADETAENIREFEDAVERTRAANARLWEMGLD